MHGATLLDVPKPFLEQLDSVIDQSAIRLQLRFAGSADANAATELLEVGPHPRQAWQHVLELRELDLHLRLVGLGADREDVEDQFGAIHDALGRRILDILSLTGRELVVEDDERGVALGGQRGKLLDLALAEVGAGMWPVDLLDELTDNLRTGCVGEFGEFPEVFIRGPPSADALTRGANENRALDWLTDADQIFTDVLLNWPSVRSCCICPSARMESCSCRPPIRP